MDFIASIIKAVLAMLGLAEKSATANNAANERDIGRKLQSADESAEIIKTQDEVAKASTNAPQDASSLSERLRKGEA